MQRIFIKKCFLFTVGVFVAQSGSQLSREILWRTKVLKRRCGCGWDNVKRHLCCIFRRTGKAMGQVYPCWWRICREMNVSPRFEYPMFYVLYPFVTYLLTLPRTHTGFLFRKVAYTSYAVPDRPSLLENTQIYIAGLSIQGMLYPKRCFTQISSLFRSCNNRALRHSEHTALRRHPSSSVVHKYNSNTTPPPHPT
jgi:hypothetical protein